MKRSKETTSRNKTNQHYGKIIGIILITIGIIFLFTAFSLNLKISATLFIIGFVIILMINEKDTHKAINDIQLILIILILTLIVWIITINSNLDIFIISIIISIITLKEFLGKFLGPHLQKRMNILFYVMFIILVIIFVQRIINISSMYPS